MKKEKHSEYLGKGSAELQETRKRLSAEETTGDELLAGRRLLVRT